MPTLAALHKARPSRSVSIFLSVIVAALPTLARAQSLDYVVVGPHPMCSIIVGKVTVDSFEVLLPASRIPDLATNRTIATVDVCECRLLSGDLKKCAIEQLSKNAQSAQLNSEEETILGDRIFIKLNKPDDFARLYTDLSETYPRHPDATAQILARALAGASSPPRSPPSSPPPTPPLPPSPPGMTPLPNKSADNEKRRCELGAKVRIDPKTGVSSIEFEVECEGLPTIVFSTEIKTGIKVGSLEVSNSANDEGKKKQ